MKDEKQPAVYMLSNGPRGTIYIGVTSALWDRVATHKDGGVEGFTSRHGLKDLVWYEHHATMDSAIKREKKIKKWNRNWKVKMIEAFSSSWIDQHDSIDVSAQFDETKLDSRLRGNDGQSV